MGSTLPYMQFYPGDWLKDPALRSCSLEARGAWIDLICLMWECPSRGVLRTNGHPWSEDQIAKSLGVGVRRAKVLVAELIDAGVAKLTDDGSISCRRIVREDEERKANSDRQQRFRDRQSDTERNGDVTPSSRDRSQKSDTEVKSQKSDTEKPTVRTGERNGDVTTLSSSKRLRREDPDSVLQDARILFRRYARDAGWEATDFGEISAENKSLWSVCLREHGKDQLLAAVKVWMEERRDMPKRFNPAGTFMKRIDEYIEAAKDAGDDGEGYPDLTAIHRQEEAERKRELAAIEEREKRKRELSESGQPRGGTTG